jgi:hypothetical protein
MSNVIHWAAGSAHTHALLQSGLALAAFSVVLLCAALWGRGGVAVRAFVIAGLGAAATIGAVSVADWVAARDHAAERHALESRAFDLTARSLAPGSAVACLDEIAGEAVQEACEKAVFATPESTAAAVSYASAQVALITAAARIPAGAEPTPALENVRRAIELDRYGMVAHIFASRAGCQSGNCKLLGLLQDPTRVNANLSERPFDAYVRTYAANWAAASPRSAAGEQGGPAMASARPPSKLYFPSSRSIPPVSIISPEPAGQEASAATDATSPSRKPPQSSQATQPQRQPAPAGAGRSSPLQIAPGAQ